MPTFSHDYLRKVTYEIFKAAGTPDQAAQDVADGLISSNLAGHDSHGVGQVPVYVDRIKAGHIVPDAPFVVEKETRTTAMINGNWGFGFAVTKRATGMLIEKALEQNIAAVTIYRQSHIGRLTPYAAMCAEQGLAAIMFTDSGRGPKAVAPFGGRGRRLGTNPVCICVPSNEDSPVFIDMASSAVAAGKLAVYRRRNLEIPLGWIIDKDGNATTDPNAYNEGGALLPVGGDLGYKGYGLSFMGEVFSGILTTLGFGLDPEGKHNDGSFIAAWRIDAFADLEWFKQQVSDFIAFIKTSPLAADSSGILYPGEAEKNMEARLLAEGIEVEDSVWSDITGLLQEYELQATVGDPA